MGFLKFLKSDKKAEHPELDLPPPPPQAKGFDDKMDFDFPNLGTEKISAPEKDDRRFSNDFPGKFPDFDFDDNAKMPSFEKDDFEAYPKFPVEKPSQPQDHRQDDQMDAMPVPPELPEEDQDWESSEPAQPPKKLFGSVKAQPMAGQKEIYIKVDNYRTAIESINSIRASLRQSEDALMKIDGIKNSKDRTLEKFKSSLDDLQKKIIFVDKTLFKGD